jgi:hypothetical protein
VQSSGQVMKCFVSKRMSWRAQLQGLSKQGNATVGSRLGERMIEAGPSESVAKIADRLPTLFVSWRPKLQKALIYADRFFESAD